ncbi:putative ATP-dependent endonuclease of OLD family [Rhizobium leguminosarum]|uniref:ATP-dependent endonuclease of OLD family n=1 Tax=Rhizobium leguminosarum TaxID=384 RepID=A0AAE2MIF4_RHILE|nr:MULTISPECIES: AAA family ATPase [Rhizobium]MBB4289725.1 putative ATP-dependent endonuclease of OLD family [Rhizobium leguminosarum]MBB4296369.1 putative ATP-dependent endonuclease of OLD family [Rhizobium leguminosarum]MBB4308371.1 putative ATP-dependent endonuclease of OLD family [Rhizobium leguminosarum]MBB4416207.1 putative ATP-dependent endonuclease of OLD family [Rhizobium leguminosarum]MBB4430826.1 putative ATP-dependent endonuclease of OLD family [Rhizobium esperanzae]
MKLKHIAIRNFRRLENVTIDVEEKETIFVGPNNSGKTSATAIFRCFLGGRDFKIHDFSVARIADFETLVENEASGPPEISLDLWFEIDPNTIAFGRVFSLLPKLSDFTRVGFRLTYGINDVKKLREQYFAAYPSDENGKRSQTLFEYLATDANLARHSAVRYASLEEAKDENDGVAIVATPVEPEEGKRLVKQLIRVEFVDAQRNINDDDNSRSNRLSAAFASYYRKNLEQAESAAEAHRVIDENNAQLTSHYEVQFAPLISLIKGLGVPSVNDRELRIISSLTPETALRGNTELLYIDPNRQHELPELYNGLGFKNLIYMAIQARHFHSQWQETAENRPLCLLIFIEEPEVHLHAQVQQTFITNIWSVINQSAAGKPEFTPQLVVTTHSSHILDAVDFEKVRYFQRSYLAGETVKAGIRNASDVLSLRAFSPEADIVEGVAIPPSDTLAFLKRYLRLTHCDLFFADAAILVEGAAEKLLLPSMIEQAAKRLRTCYLTVLEVGGAYAHRFEGLLAFLRIPYLVITDLDSVQPAGYPSICRADVAGARTSNASLKKLCGKETVGELISLQSADKIDEAKDRCIAFEGDVLVIEGANQFAMRPRTLEEAIAYENFAMVRSGSLSIGVAIPEALAEAYEQIYERIKSSEFKKTDFAMNLLANTAIWTVPAYIADGLRWLELRLCGPAPKEPPTLKDTDGAAPALKSAGEAAA